MKKFLLLIIVLSFGIFGYMAVFFQNNYIGEKNNLFTEVCKNKNSNIKINQKIINVKNACSNEDRTAGLMNVKEMPIDNGMLFVFENEQYLRFWMKNTYIPLDIAYINNNLEIVDIFQLVPHDQNPISSSVPVSFALEVNQNYFRDNNIKKGDKIDFTK